MQPAPLCASLFPRFTPLSSWVLSRLTLCASLLLITLAGCTEPTPSLNLELVADLDPRGNRYGCLVRYSSDGKFIASAREDGLIQIWDSATLKKRLSFKATEGELGGFAVAPDSKTLATGDWDHVIIWDSATGKRVAVLKTRGGPFNALAFSPSGKILAVGGYEGFLEIWDAHTYRRKAIFEGRNKLGAAAFSPDGKILAVGRYRRCGVTLRDKGTWKVRADWDLRAHEVRSLAFSRDGKTLAAAGGRTNNVMVWDVRSLKLLATLDCGRVHTYGVAISPDTKTLAVATGLPEKSGQVQFWDLTTRTRKGVHRIDKHWITGVAYSPDGTRLVTGDSLGRVKVWDLPK